MPIRWARSAVAAFFALYVLAVTLPVGEPFTAAEPFVLGLPFSFFWPALWIALSGIVLVLLDRVEERERAGAGAKRAGPGAERGGPGAAPDSAAPREERGR